MLKRFFAAALAAVCLITTGRALELGPVQSGDIGLYEDIACTKPVLAPVGSRAVRPGRTYYIKEASSGRIYSGSTCYIYANAVYNTLFGEVPYHGYSETWQRSKRAAGPAKAVSFAQFRSWGVEPGSLMRTTVNSDGSYSSNYGHSLIILAYDESSVTYLEGNGDGRGLVRTANKTWDSFNSAFLTGKGYTLSFIVSPSGPRLAGYFRKSAASAWYSDVKSTDWYYTGILEATQLGLMNGRGDGKFTPQGVLTKAEAVTLAARLLSLYYDDRYDFTPGGTWYEPYYRYLAIWGISLDMAKAGERASRSYVTELFYRVFPKKDLEAIKEFVPFSDTEATEAVKCLVRAGIIQGSDGKFRPNDTVTRAEAAAIVTRLADKNERLR